MSSAARLPSRPSGPTLAGAVLGLSLLLNGVLLARLGHTDDASAASKSAGPASDALAATAAPPPPPADAPAAPAPADLWSALESADLEQLVSRLRAAGFPEDLVRAIAWDRITHGRAEDTSAEAETPYWRRIAVRTAAAQQRLAERRIEAMTPDVARFEALFGEKPDVGLSPDAGDVTRARLGLSPEISTLVGELRRERDTAIGERRSRYVNGEPDEATRAMQERQREANARFEAALRARLSPADYETYLRQASETAQVLRSQSGLLQLSQSEFDTLLQTFGPAFEPRGSLQNYAETLTAAFGEDRFAELTQAFQGDIQTNRIVQRLGLPASTAIALQGIREEIIERNRTLSRDRTLSREQQQTQRIALGEEARQRLVATLPAEGVDLYLEHAGFWLKSLQPPPNP